MNLKKIFNSKFFIEEKIDDNSRFYYVFYRNYVIFGFSIIEKLDVCYTIKDLNETLEVFGIKQNECENYPK